MSSVKKLSRFQNHFDYMFIAVPLGTLPCPATQEEDIHLPIEKRDILPKCFRF
jgi:hypothetical protein